RAHDRWSRAELRAHQDRLQRQVREYAYQHSPFYQDLHKGLFDAPLEQLPPVGKLTLMEHYDEAVSDRSIHLEDVRRHLHELSGDALFGGQYRLMATSGTTGQPGLFLASRDEWLWIMASFWRAQELSGRHLTLTRRTRMASLGASAPYYMTTRVAASLQSWWTPQVRLDVMGPFEDLVESLNRAQPEVLASYPSLSVKLAAEQIAGNLKISPRRVFTGAEPLFPDARAQMETAWGKCVFDLYAATEVGAVAAECEAHRGLHLMEDLFIPEVVDGDNRPVPDGEMGVKLLVTRLHGTTLPMIRYELSDCLVISPEPCPCGRPYRLIERIQGKSEHVLQMKGADGGTVPVHLAYVADDVLDVIPVNAWQVQAHGGGISLLVVGLPEEYAECSIAAGFERALSELGAAKVPIEVKRVADIPRGPSGKAVPVVIDKGT
ncbi:MAG: phenylacetate--CoA ligase family protein, partial [Chloroflexi bacterium]|nr:phenylacetate--CoA ligase family protein [Chloroflexota bacterium]